MEREGEMKEGEWEGGCSYVAQGTSTQYTLISRHCFTHFS